MKLWLYQFYMLMHLSWVFTTSDLDITFAKQLQDFVQVYLKKWAGVGRTVDPAILYRSKSNFGLGLTSVVAHYKLMQLSKYSLLKSSVDNDVVKIYEAKARKESTFVRVRKSTQFHTSMDAQAHLDLLFPTQISRQGLGNRNFNANPSKKERRNLTALAAKRALDEAHIVHAHGLAMQGNWLQWTESSVPLTCPGKT